MKSLIAIDGIDGSGKSTFARKLAGDLATSGCGTVIVSIDDFRRPVDWNALSEPEVDVYYNGYYDLALAEQTLRAFLAGEPRVTIPRYDTMTERLDGTRDLVFEAAQVAVVEGVFPLRVAAVREGLLIVLDVKPEEARRRIIARDIKKNRTREETERRIDRRYFPAQERYRAACEPIESADVLIENTNPAEPVVLKRDLSRAREPARARLERLLPARR